jgi:hypothetical protein
MFFQVRLPFGFVPNEHELIVSTFWGQRTSGGILLDGGAQDFLTHFSTFLRADGRLQIAKFQNRCK